MADDDDDDTEVEVEQPCRLSAAEALYEVLETVPRECERLDIAIQNQDPECAALAAQDAVASLVAAMEALRMIDVATKRSDLVLARLATYAAYRVILDQFALVTEQVDSLPLHRFLLRLRLSLALMYGEPMPLY